MARRINQVQLIARPIAARVEHAHGLGLDGDPFLALQVHPVEDLLLHLARINRARALQQAIRQGGLAVVNVGDDAKVAYQH